jgi:hypothetical protein
MRWRPRPLQEDHHFLNGLLLLPRAGDEPGLLGPDTGHLDQALRLFLDDAQDICPEVSDHPLGHHRADALDQPRSQITLDPLNRRGQHRRIRPHLELTAIPWV